MTLPAVLLALFCLCCGWRLGPLPALELGCSPGEVQGALPEPGLRQAVGAALDRSLAAGSGLALDVELLRAGSRAVSAGAEVQELELALRLTPRGHPERAVQVQGREPFTLVPNDPLATEQARDAAARALADALVQQALLLLAQSPEPACR